MAELKELYRWPHKMKVWTQTLLLEVPLGGNRGIDEERLVVVGVIDEIVADLDLRPETQMGRDIIPELGLGEDDQLSVAVGLLAAPEVDEARET